MKELRLYVCLITLSISLGLSAQILKEKKTIGRVEWIELPELKLKFKARIDTGAKTTSLHAIGIEEMNQQGELYVKFKTIDAKGETKELIRKVESSQSILNQGFSSRRYVIREKVKLGSYTKEISINLNDRDKMDYKFLVGRNLLLGAFLVDVARSHVLGD